MKKLLNKIINGFSPTRPAYKTLLRNKNSYLYKVGWMESKKRGYPCRTDGSELPWMNYAVISFLENRLKKDFSLFEFGSGYSTIFYSRLVAHVTSIEYDEKWFKFIKNSLPANSELIFTKDDIDGHYCRAISLSDSKYDVVIVDGRDRVNCIKQSLGKLTDRGVIILDDSNRMIYKDGLLYAKENGFRSIDFEGLKPSGNKVDRTTILYRDNNCFGI